MVSDEQSPGRGTHIETNENEEKRPPLERTDQDRSFLARCTVLLLLLVLIVYLITRDISVLAASTLIGVAVCAVFRYYFPSRRE